MFNLKSAANKNVIPTEKQLIELNKEINGKENPAESSGNIAYLNKKEHHTDPDGLEITEKQLDKNRKAFNSSILEKELNDSKKGVNGMLHRHKEPSIPLMDFHKEHENKLSEDFKKADKKDEKDRNTELWDKYVGEQLLGDKPKKIMNNVQPSQLVSNYDTRKDFNKENPSIKVASSLRDADAMLYYLYRSAALQDRNLTDEEQQMVNDINSGKIRVLAEKNDENYEDNARQDEIDMITDDLEEGEKKREEVKGDKEDTKACGA